jgi:hypothetical protein
MRSILYKVINILIIISFFLTFNTKAKCEVFLGINKKNATITIVDNSKNLDGKSLNRKVIFPMLYGDDTPTGEFKLKHGFSSKLNERIIVFKEYPTYVYSIHPLWLGNPKEDRKYRLASETPYDNKITKGCINVHPDLFYDILAKLPDGTRIFVK